MLCDEGALLLGECNLWNEEYDELVVCVFLGRYPLYEKGTDESFAAACVQRGDHVSMNGLLKDFFLISAWYQAVTTESGLLCGH